MTDNDLSQELQRLRRTSLKTIPFAAIGILAAVSGLAYLAVDANKKSVELGEAKSQQLTLERSNADQQVKLAATTAEIETLRQGLKSLEPIRATAVEANARAAALQAELETTQSQLASKTEELTELRKTAEQRDQEARAVVVALETLKRQLSAASIDASRDGVLRFDNAVLFEPGESSIDCARQLVMAKVVAYVAHILARNPRSTATVIGHTDDTWKTRGLSRDEIAEKNLELSIKRADSVVQYLGSAGIRRDALKSIGMGLTQPAGYDAPQSAQVIADANKREDQRSRNRRVELRIEKPAR